MADRRGPETEGGASGAFCVNVERSPRTSRRRISSMLSVSTICVRRKRCRSVGWPTFELVAHDSRTVKMVGASMSLRSAYEQSLRGMIAYRVRIDDFNSPFPTISGIASNPEHAAEHATKPLLNIAGLDPARF